MLRSAIIPLVVLACAAPVARAQDGLKIPRPLPSIDTDRKPGFDPAFANAALPITPEHVLTGTPRGSGPTVSIPGVPGAVPCGPPRGVVSFGDGADGELWAAGDTYKIGFAPDGVTFVPFFGSDAPRGFPVTFGPAVLVVDAVPNAGGGIAVGIERHGHHAVTLSRPGLTETWHLGAEHAEQTFVVDVRPAGDAALCVPVTTELRAGTTADGIRFEGRHGAVRYSSALLVDADGRRFPLPTSFAAGAVRIDLPRSITATARFPAVVDPVVSTHMVNTTSWAPLLDGEVAYDRTHDRYAFVGTQLTNGTDRDVYVAITDGAGQLVGFGWVDLGPDSWITPRIANNDLSDNFLVVASRSIGGTGASHVAGRTVSAIVPASGTLSMGPVFQISGPESGAKRYADVGGDYNPIPPTYFLVVWERVYGAGDTDIHARLVDATGNVHGPVIPIENSAASLDGRPRVSKCAGAPPASQQSWQIVWEREAAGVWQIFHARLSWDGTSLGPPSIAVPGTLSAEPFPAVSSTSDTIDGERTFMVVHEQPTRVPGGSALGWARLVGPTIRATGFVNVASTRPMRLPSIDCDGRRFLIAWSELFGTADWNLRMTTSTWNGVPSEAIEEVNSLPNRASGVVTVSAQRSGGGTEPRRFTAAWSDRILNPGPFLAYIGEFALLDSRLPGSGFRLGTGTYCASIAMQFSQNPPVPGGIVDVTMSPQPGLQMTGMLLYLVRLGDTLVCAPPNPCQVDAALFAQAALWLPGTRHRFLIPDDPHLIGQTFAVQGAAFQAPQGCPALLGIGFGPLVEISVR